MTQKGSSAPRAPQPSLVPTWHGDLTTKGTTTQTFNADDELTSTTTGGLPLPTTTTPLVTCTTSSPVSEPDTSYSYDQIGRLTSVSETASAPALSGVHARLRPCRRRHDCHDQRERLHRGQCGDLRWRGCDKLHCRFGQPDPARRPRRHRRDGRHHRHHALRCQHGRRRRLNSPTT